MKFLLVNILLICSFAAIGQGSKTYDNLAATKSFVPPFFPDTTAANTAGAKKPNAVVTTTNGGSKYWLRDSSNKVWQNIFKNDSLILVAESNMVIRKDGNTVFFSALSGSGGLVGYGFNGTPAIVYLGTGFNYHVVTPDYYINGKHYEGVSANFTLDASDGTNDRDDRIAVDTLGAIVKIKGDAAVNHFPKGVDGLSQLEVTTILVKAGTTTPSGITTSVIIDEGTESDTVNTMSALGSFRSTAVIPYSGTYTTFTGAYHAGSLTFTKAFTLPANNDQTVSFAFKLKNINDKVNANGLQLQLYNNGAGVGNLVIIKPYPAPNNFGLINDTAWHLVAIPMSYFGSNFTFDRLRIYTAYSNASGFYIDKLIVQGGIIPVTNQKAIVGIKTDAGNYYALNDKAVPYFKGLGGLDVKVGKDTVYFDASDIVGGGGMKFGDEDNVAIGERSFDISGHGFSVLDNVEDVIQTVFDFRRGDIEFSLTNGGEEESTGGIRITNSGDYASSLVLASSTGIYFKNASGAPFEDSPYEQTTGTLSNKLVAVMDETTGKLEMADPSLFGGGGGSDLFGVGDNTATGARYFDADGNGFDITNVLDFTVYATSSLNLVTTGVLQLTGGTNANVISDNILIQSGGPIKIIGTETRFESPIVSFKYMPVYANNASAITGGLVADDVYKTSTGELRIVF